MKFLTFAQGAGTCVGSPLDGGDVINLTSLLRQEWGVQATVPHDLP